MAARQSTTWTAAAAALCGGLTLLPSSGAGGRPAAPPLADSGRHVFAAACADCHTLTGSDSIRRSGGDLLRVALSRSQLVDFTREMPVRRPLTDAQVRAVVSYVLRVQRAGGISGGAAG